MPSPDKQSHETMPGRIHNVMLETSNLLRAVFVFLAGGALGLAVMLVTVGVPLSGIDPFLGDLARLWWLVALQMACAVLGWGLLLGPFSHATLTETRARWVPGLMMALLVLGAIAGHLEFELRYAQLQAQWTQRVIHDFQETMNRIGFDKDVGFLASTPDPARPFCAQALREADHLATQWDTYRRGGQTASLGLQTIVVSKLSHHGCLTPSARLEQRSQLDQAAREALTRLSYERFLPVWGWPLRSWWDIHHQALVTQGLLQSPSPPER